MADKIEKGMVFSDSDAIAEAVRAKDSERSMRSSLSQIKKENVLLRDERNEAKDQLDSYLQISEETPLFDLATPKTKKGSTDSYSVPVFLWSDWHTEEHIEKDQVRGMNEFNLDIADARIQRLGNKSVEYVKSREDETEIPEVIVWLGGDFISGYIHEELMTINQLSPPDATLWVKARIKSMLEYIAREFPKVRVVCNVGNHGRTTMKRWMHNGQRNSFEWLMYHCLADELAHLKNVEFFIPASYFCEFSVFDFKVRTHHGDAVMFGGGVGGPSIPINKSIANWNVADQVDIDYFGHLHTFIDHHQWVLNGSLIGYSPFAIQIKAKFQRPIQVVDFIHHKHGRTDTLKIYLD